MFLHLPIVAGCAEKDVPGRSTDNLKSAAMNIKVRLAIQVANAERHVRETLDEDGILISLHNGCYALLARHRERWACFGGSRGSRGASRRIDPDMDHR
jgi:hypothetical protein